MNISQANFKVAHVPIPFESTVVCSYSYIYTFINVVYDGVAAEDTNQQDVMS